ncbi:MAG: methyltransferase domain-containing protein [Betaproteobacteria bacterium]|nr:methyltransferase domain-containing protein [Betaproteobacteria bacterium]
MSTDTIWEKQRYYDIYKNHQKHACHKWVHYPFVYDQILARHLDAGKPLRLLEIGVQNGGSLEIWKKFLPAGSEIHGMDINPKCLELVFGSKDIHFHLGNATDEVFLNRLFDDMSFDIIVDDGSHMSGDIISAFFALFKKVNPGGIYIIEDLHASYWESYGGGLRRKNSAIEFLKQFIDTLHSDYIPGNQFSNILDFMPFQKEYRQEIASISFYDSVCAITKFAQKKLTPFCQVVNGNIYKVAEATSFQKLVLKERLQDFETANLLYATTGNESNIQSVAKIFQIDSHPLIESLQIYTEKLADEFQEMWFRGIDYLRFEWVSLPGETKKTLAADVILHSTDKKHLMTILGILVKEDGVHFPSLFKNWELENLAYLTAAIIEPTNELVPTDGITHYRLNHNPSIPYSEVTAERMIPGLWSYQVVTIHIKCYLFLYNLILPGKILECACGAGYGAVIFSRLGTVSEYYGVDMSEIAVGYAKTGVWDKKTDFHLVNLAESTPSLYENVVSLQTIEHVPNPYKFMELLIDKMLPDGQMLISIPIETRYGSHINSYHLSNWNYKRLQNFLEQYFEDITIFTQKAPSHDLSVFEILDVTDSPPDENSDAVFVAVLRRPCKKKRPNIILKKSGTLGDVIWTTPILSELRRLYPEHNVLVSTDKTEVFLHNPDADLVFGTQYEPLPDDMVIDLNGTCETRRGSHLLHAYAEASGISPTANQPSLYPINAEIFPAATHMLRRFQHGGIERLIAVYMADNPSDHTWFKAHWQRFIAGLLQQNKKLGIVILEHEEGFSAADVGFAPDCRILSLQLPWMHSAATVLPLCDLLVAPDSDALHIAAAVSVPCLGLSGRVPEEALAITGQMLGTAAPEGWKTRCQKVCPDKAFIGTEQQHSPVHQTPGSPLEQGIQAFNQEDLETAIECLSAAMTQEPDNPLPYAYLAFVCVRQGLLQEARDFIAQSTRLAPERADIIAAFGEVFLKHDRFSEAVEYLQEAVQLQPDLYAAYPALAQSLHLTGQSEEAISLLQTASNIPSNAQQHIRDTLQQILAE